MAICERIVGKGILFRCVEKEDAEQILTLRNDPQLSLYLPPLNVTIEQQAEWIEKQRTREMEYYFAAIDKISGEVIGLSGLYDFKTDENGRRTIEWGRFVIKQKSLGAAETSMLTHKFAFEQLNIDEVYGFSVEDNVPIQSFHRSCGLEDRGICEIIYELRGVKYASRCWALKKENWPAFNLRLSKSVEMAARLAVRTNK